MKKTLSAILKLSGALILLYFTIGFMISNNERPQIGIIGGADAPTAIFLTSALFKTPVPYLIILGILLIITGIIIGRKNKNK